MRSHCAVVPLTLTLIRCVSACSLEHLCVQAGKPKLVSFDYGFQVRMGPRPLLPFALS